MPDEYDIAQDEAANWIVVLMDDPDDIEQQARFQAWLTTRSVNAEAWQRVQRTYAGLGQVTPTTSNNWPSSQEYESISNQPSADGRSTSYAQWRNWKKPIISLALAACVLVMMLPTIGLHLFTDYVTGTAEQQTINLTDGSRVYLAPESAMNVSFSVNERQINLLKGDAYFEVAPSVNRPFKVKVGDTQVTVVGTAFNVQRTDEEAVVSVAHGHVRVDDESIEPVISQELKVGDALAVAWGKHAVRSKVTPDEVAQWRNDELIARDLPVSHIVNALRKYHKGSIIVSSDFAQRRVTGFYRLQNPVATLNELAASHGGAVYQITPWLLFVTD